MITGLTGKLLEVIMSITMSTMSILQSIEFAFLVSLREYFSVLVSLRKYFSVF